GSTATGTGRSPSILSRPRAPAVIARSAPDRPARTPRGSDGRRGVRIGEPFELRQREAPEPLALTAVRDGSGHRANDVPRRGLVLRGGALASRAAGEPCQRGVRPPREPRDGNRTGGLRRAPGELPRRSRRTGTRRRAELACPDREQ